MSNNRFVGDKNIFHNFQVTIQSRNNFYDKLNDLAKNLDYVRKKLEDAQHTRGYSLPSLDPNMLGSKEDFSNIKDACKMQKEFIRQVSGYGFMDSIFINKIQQCDSNCANYLDQAINEKGGIAFVNGRDNIYTVNEYYDSPTMSVPQAVSMGGASAADCKRTRIPLDEYLKMDDLIPPNFKSAIDQIGKLMLTINNTFIDGLDISEEEKEIRRINLQQQESIDLIYANNTIIYDLISTYAREHGEEDAKKAALFHIGVGITSLILAIPTGGASLYVASAFEAATLGADFIYSLNTGRDYYTHQRLDNADLVTKGIFSFLGILLEACTLVEPIKAIDFSKGLGKKAVATDLSTVSSDIKVVNASKETLESGGRSSAKSFANNLDKQANGIVYKSANDIDESIKKVINNPQVSMANNPLYPKNVLDDQLGIKLVDKEGKYTHYQILGEGANRPIGSHCGYDRPIEEISDILGLNKGGKNICDVAFPIVDEVEFKELVKLLKEKGRITFPNGQILDLSNIDFNNVSIIKTADHHILRTQFQYIPGEDKPIYIVLKQVSENSDELRRIVIYYEGNRAIDIELEDKLVHLQYWKKIVDSDTKVITVERIDEHYYDVDYLR